MRPAGSTPPPFAPGTSAAVTGAGAGIGRAIALGLARAGARVAVGDIDAEAAQRVAAEIGDAALAFALDVADRERLGAFLDEAEARHGALGVMVNNAGVDWVGPFHEEPDEVTRREIEVNLYGATLGSKLALARMLPRGHGHLVNIASGVGRVPLPGSATYAATKHGIVGLTESLRLEYRGRGIAFTVVQPSQVRTAMIAGQPQPWALPVVGPEDVAAAVLEAIRRRRFEVWVPRSQGASAKVGLTLPRPVRDVILRASASPGSPATPMPRPGATITSGHSAAAETNAEQPSAARPGSRPARARSRLGP